MNYKHLSIEEREKIQLMLWQKQSVRAMAKRSSRGERKMVKDNRLRNYVIRHLKLGWSPEQIAAKAEEASGAKISHEAIYQYIYAQIHRNGYGLPRPGCQG